MVVMILLQKRRRASNRVLAISPVRQTGSQEGHEFAPVLWILTNHDANGIEESAPA
jgi:hypothetical protein